VRIWSNILKNDFGRAFLEEQVEEVYSQDFRTVSGVLFDFRRTELVVEEQEDEKMSSRLMLLDVYLEVVEDLSFVRKITGENSTCSLRSTMTWGILYSTEISWWRRKLIC
jgi:hypothetical protein